MQLYDKTILITGGTSGIGEALVRQLASRNRAILILARNADKLARLTESLGNVHGWPCQLEDSTALAATVAEILSQYPDLSVVINNAGVQATPRLTDSDFRFDGIAEEININLTAPIQLCALTLPSLLARGEAAAYINLSSGLALAPKANAAVYCATKAGLLNFSRGLRLQLAETTIKVHAVLLPLVDTPMTDGRGSNKLSADEAATQIIEGVEQGEADIYVGKARWLPWLARLSPRLLSRVLSRA